MKKEETNKISKTLPLVQKKSRETKISKAFINVLAIVSILGFLSIITESILNIEINQYLEPLWLISLGLGFIAESNPKNLAKSIRTELGERNFTRITTFIIGMLAIIAGIFSIPQINISHPTFLAVKGIMSLVAIIFIVIQTWVIK